MWDLVPALYTMHAKKAARIGTLYQLSCNNTALRRRNLWHSDWELGNKHAMLRPPAAISPAQVTKLARERRQKAKAGAARGR